MRDDNLRGVIVDDFDQHARDLELVIVAAITRIGTLSKGMLDRDAACPFGQRILRCHDVDILWGRPIAACKEQRRDGIASNLGIVNLDAQAASDLVSFLLLAYRNSDPYLFLRGPCQDNAVTYSC